MDTARSIAYTHVFCTKSAIAFFAKFGTIYLRKNVFAGSHVGLCYSGFTNPGRRRKMAAARLDFSCKPVCINIRHLYLVRYERCRARQKQRHQKPCYTAEKKSCKNGLYYQHCCRHSICIIFFAGRVAERDIDVTLIFNLFFI